MRRVQTLPTADPESGIGRAGDSRSLMRRGGIRDVAQTLKRCLRLVTHAGGEEEVDENDRRHDSTGPSFILIRMFRLVPQEGLYHRYTL